MVKMLWVCLMVFGLVVWEGCGCNAVASTALKVPSMVSSEAKVPHQKQFYREGHILGVSRKAQVITLLLNGEVTLIHFEADTKGLEYAHKGENVVVRLSEGIQEQTALEIVPKLAKIPAGVREIDADEVVEFVYSDTDDYLLIDVRDGRRFQLGHIPTAQSLPLIDLQQKPDRLKALQAANKKLIFYSNGTTCGLCTKAAELAVQEGFEDVRVLLSGFKGWEAEDELLAVSDALIVSRQVVLIDLRSVTEVQSGHIDTAVGIPLADLEGEMEYELPTQKQVPLVFYGAAADIVSAAQVVRKWGFRNIYGVDGGLAGWVSRGGAVSVGPAAVPSAIAWNPIPHELQMAKRAFLRATKKEKNTLTIVDVRTDREVQRGGFKNALHIPLESLADRLDEIPRDTKIVTHCASGERARMAALFLQQFRDDVHYLAAKVRCRGEKCRVK